MLIFYRSIFKGEVDEFLRVWSMSDIILLRRCFEIHVILYNLFHFEVWFWAKIFFCPVRFTRRSTIVVLRFLSVKSVDLCGHRGTPPFRMSSYKKTGLGGQFTSSGLMKIRWNLDEIGWKFDEIWWKFDENQRIWSFSEFQKQARAVEACMSLSKKGVNNLPIGRPHRKMLKID